MLLENKIAVVTGSSRGIGAAIARAFAREGAKVVVTYYTQKEKAEKIAEEIGSEISIQLNVCNRGSVKNLFQTTVNRLGKIDILVNNAGINITGNFDKISDEDWDKVLDVDLKGVFICCQEVLPHIKDGGRIINIGSLSGEYGGPRTPSYAAAKAGVMALTQCLARFVAHRGITANCLSPGIIESELTEKTMSSSLFEKIKPTILLGRMGRLEEVAETAVFLASDGASYITAQTISVNGGAWW